MEEWKTLEPDYPDYAVSSYGQVMNVATQRILAQSMNNTGFMKVAINDRQGVRRTLEVSRMVALAFVPGYSDQNNTPIHLDGNREHTFADNLAWRPLWFAVLYHKQFTDSRHRINVPIIEVRSGRVHPDSLDAARTYGVLEQHIMLSTVNGWETYPDGYIFQLATPA